MQRSPFSPALAEALGDRLFGADDSERRLHIIYLANDILFDSLQRRINPRDLDNEALAFKPFWASKEVYDHVTIHALENEMIGGPPTNFFPIFGGSGKTYTMKPLPLKASRDILKLMHHTYWN
ncbi:hypothetical protein HYC85_017350 [Camellia sinensis]|uniref:CID domain-containing protein n=1 Tax=Camellia sinensis TaxID=4442 RepID=A0A7J7H2D5_CAMSI|nr:hypothetical protein HYC85_017350 [Camellia sinensis]